MKTHLKYVVLASALAGVAACSGETARNWNNEAGSQLDTGSFGNATFQNMVAQTCNRGMKGWGHGAKGGAIADPVVVLDPQSTPVRPVYRVHCGGRLDGKYAQVVYNEYIRSAPPEQANAAIAAAVDTGEATE